MLPRQREKLQIQPPKAKLPYPGVPVRALKISTACLCTRRDIPASTALVSNKWEVVMFRYLLYKCSICLDGLEPIGD